MGVRHIAMFRFVEGTTSAEIAAVDDALSTLPEQIEALRAYTYGADLDLSDGTWDYAVVADMADADGYLAYRDHQAHQQVVHEVIKPLTADRASVQFETP